MFFSFVYIWISFRNPIIKSGWLGITLNGLAIVYVWLFMSGQPWYVVSSMTWGSFEVIVDNGGIVDYNCLNVLFMIKNKI